MKRIVLCFLIASAVTSVCHAADVGLLGELIPWPSAIGFAKSIARNDAPLEQGTRFPASDTTIFGSIPLGDGPDSLLSVAFEGGESPRLWVDCNNNEDLTDDADPTWSDHPASDLYTWIRTVRVSYAGDSTGSGIEYMIRVSALRTWDGWDLYYGSYCLRKGLLWTDDGVHVVWLGDADSDGVYDDLESLLIIVDTDGNGVPSIDYSVPEYFYPGFPLDVGRIQVADATYTVDRVSPDGRLMEVARSEEQEAPLPQVLVGEKAPSFEVETLQGEKISSDDLLGRAVVLLFTPILSSGACASCGSNELPARICELATALEGTSVVLIAISTTADAPDIAALDCDAISIPLVWDYALLRAYRPRLDWAVVIGPDGIVLGKDSVHPLYNSRGYVIGAENDPLSTDDILRLVLPDE